MSEQPRPAVLARRRVLGLAAAGALAACRRPAPPAPARPHPLDVARLSAEFPALAARARPGLFALGVVELATSTTWYWNIDRPFPLAGAAALPIAAAVLAQVDAGRLALTDGVDIGAADLSAPPSAIAASWPAAEHTARVPVGTLLALALQAGDNTALDLLMKRIGGPGAVTEFLRQKGIAGLDVDRYQREIAVQAYGLPGFRPDWKDPAALEAAREQVAPARRDKAMVGFVVDKRDAATLPAVLQLLAMLAGRQLLLAASTSQLLAWMGAAKLGASRLAAGLPAGVGFAHATGALPTDLGFTPAVADLGIATFAHGRRYALAAFLAGATGSEPQRDRLFADAARLAAQAAD
jgi:beta-lactamase class A